MGSCSQESLLRSFRAVNFIFLSVLDTVDLCSTPTGLTFHSLSLSKCFSESLIPFLPSFPLTLPKFVNPSASSWLRPHNHVLHIQALALSLVCSPTQMKWTLAAIPRANIACTEYKSSSQKQHFPQPQRILPASTPAPHGPKGT